MSGIVIYLVRTLQCYPNNKPWNTSDNKDLLNQKKRVFQDENNEKRRSVQQELKKILRRTKMEYKKKVERQLEKNNTSKVWRGIRTISGYKMKNSVCGR